MIGLFSLFLAFVTAPLKSKDRLEWRPQNGQYETKQRDHGLLTLGVSFG
jgi:hypothetical protein